MSFECILNMYSKYLSALDYVFSTFSGILATSTLYFLVYAAYQRNRPKVYPGVILPGFVSGAMWGVATTAWFVANKVLSEAVAFPIITTGPGVVASLLGVFMFREIQVDIIPITILKDKWQRQNCWGQFGMDIAADLLLYSCSQINLYTFMDTLI